MPPPKMEADLNWVLIVRIHVSCGGTKRPVVRYQSFARTLLNPLRGPLSGIRQGEAVTFKCRPVHPSGRFIRLEQTTMPRCHVHPYFFSFSKRGQFCDADDMDHRAALQFDEIADLAPHVATIFDGTIK